jgi:hypothetical protein
MTEIAGLDIGTSKRSTYLALAIVFCEYDIQVNQYHYGTAKP